MPDFKSPREGSAHPRDIEIRFLQIAARFSEHSLNVFFGLRVMDETWASGPKGSRRIFRRSKSHASATGREDGKLPRSVPARDRKVQALGKEK